MRLRQFLQIEGFVGGDAVLCARRAADVARRPAAGRDQDAFCCDFAVALFQMQRVGICEFRALHDDFDACLDRHSRGRRLRCRAISLFFVGDRALPVERRLAATVQPKPGGSPRNPRDSWLGIDEQLLRDTAADDTGAAEAVFLGDRHARAG